MLTYALREKFVVGGRVHKPFEFFPDVCVDVDGSCGTVEVESFGGGGSCCGSAAICFVCLGVATSTKEGL